MAREAQVRVATRDALVNHMHRTVHCEHMWEDACFEKGSRPMDVYWRMLGVEFRQHRQSAPYWSMTPGECPAMSYHVVSLVIWVPCGSLRQLMVRRAAAVAHACAQLRVCECESHRVLPR